MKAARPSVFSQVSQLQSAVQSSQKYILGSVAVVFMVLAVQFVLTVVAFDMSKDTSVSQGLLLDKTSGSVVKTLAYEDVDVSAPSNLNMAYLKGMKTIEVAEGFSLAMEHEVLGREVRPCPEKGSVCCEEKFGLAYLLYTSHYVFAAKQASPTAPVTVAICNDQDFLEAMKQVSAAPESTEQRSRRLLQIDETTYHTTCVEDKGRLSCTCRECRSIRVTADSPDCTGFAGGANPSCAIWTDAAGFEHKTKVQAGDWTLNSFKDNWSAGAGAAISASKSDRNALADYCLSGHFGSLGRIYGKYKINKCSRESLQSNYWNQLVPEYLMSVNYQVDVWGWVHTSNPLGLYLDNEAITGDDGVWGMNDLSFIIWHSYTFSALQHGGLAGQCQMCYACRPYTLAMRNGNILDEPWQPDTQGLTAPFSVDTFNSYMRATRTSLDRDDWTKDDKHECTAYLTRGFLGHLGRWRASGAGEDTGYTMRPHCNNPNTPHYFSGCGAGHK